MKVQTLLLMAVLAAGGLLAVACTEGDTTVNPPGSATGIAVTGTGKASGAPDIVTLQLGVQVEASTVAAARDGAAASQQKVIDAIKKAGVADKDIRTVQFSIEPQYDFSTRIQTLRGYRVTNVINVTVRKVDDASKVIDDAVSAGGNNVVVRSISFSIEDPTSLRETAREEAMKDARARAGQLAKLGGVSLGGPISISEGTAVTPVPFLSAPRTGSGAEASTPIQPGELEVTVNVSVLYAIE